MVFPGQDGKVTHEVYLIGYIIAAIALLSIAGCLAVAWSRLRTLRGHMAQEAATLRHDFAEMEMAYAHAPLGLAILDCELRFVRINKLLAQLNGLSVQEHIGKSIHEVVPDVAGQAEQPLRDVIRTGEPLLGIVFEGVTRAQPGVRRFWRENFYPVFSDNGHVIGINIAAWEITEETRLNNALRASELRERQRASELEAVMNAAPAAILIAHDAGCDKITGNAEANRMLRIDPAGSDTLSHHINGSVIRGQQLPMARAASHGHEVRGEELALDFGNGDVMHVLANAAPLRNESGEVTGAVGAFIDITRQKEAEQVILRESRRKDEFLAMLAHELRNPLASIQSGMELIRLDPVASPSLAHARDIMQRQLSHLVRLIDDLFDVSRISTGKIDLRRERVAVQSVVEHALEVSRLHIEAAGHRLDVQQPGVPVYVEVDRMRMAQVVSNLLNNASKYTPEGGHIRLSVSVEETCAVVRIVDDGIGIEKEMLPRVFDMFSQLESSRNRRRGGIGVGLPLAKQLVEMHGGSLTADSAGAECGSVFTVRLPLSGQAGGGDMEPQARAADDAQDASARILVVDDNTDAAQMLGTLLELGGHQVRYAYNGRDAVAAAEEFRPEIAFIDIGLPDMDGHAVARTLRRQEALQAATLVALTGWGSRKDKIESQEAGFDFHLTKPTTLDAIKDILPQLKLPTGRAAADR